MAASTVAEQFELIQVLHQGDEVSLNRARRVADGDVVLLEIPRVETSRAGERLRHELEIAHSLDPDAVLHPVELSTFARTPVLVFDDFAGVPLSDLLAAPLDLATALELAHAIATSLVSIHASGIIHRNLRPENVLFDPRTKVAKLIGFGSATRMRGEHWVVRNRIEGALPYISPEQTGRLDHPIDGRSDLYSLGIMFYEMLMGARPFDAHDVVGWIHSHIARMPMPPALIASRVPQTVSDIVMKLLAKPPEERYQTAPGLEADLRRCLDEWRATSTVSAFALGQYDVSDRLQIPRKLYGRDREIEVLASTFRRVVTSGTPELVLVSGPAGSGKSSLGRSIEEHVVRAGGMFASGKFEPDVPHSAVAQALRELAAYLMCEGDDARAAWRARLHDSVGALGQLLIEAVPALESVLGAQPPLVEFQLSEAQDRFFLVVRRFLAALAGRGNVVVLLLEDLQRANAASLALLESLVTHRDTGHLMVIATHRDDPLLADQPLAEFLQRIRASEAAVQEIALPPLTLDDVTALCAETLSRSATDARPLAAVVWKLTGGDPLAAVQLLGDLRREGIVFFDGSARAWTWDLERLGEIGVRDDFGDRTLARFETLTPAARHALELGAYLGTRFDASTLSLIAHAPVELVLGEAIDAGLLSAVGDEVRFLHDRIHEAIYNRVPEQQRAALHANIGRTLLDQLSPEELADRLFAVARQFRHAADVIEQRDERLRAAELELRAGRAAASASAFARARDLLLTGIELLDAQAWEDHYELAFGLHVELARCELTHGRLDEVVQICDLLRGRARSVAQLRAIDRLMIDMHLARNEVTDAVRVALGSLASAGIEVPARLTAEDIPPVIQAVWDALGERSIASLVELPLLADTDTAAAIDLLASVLAPSYLTDPILHTVVACRAVELTIRNGVTGPAALSFASFAMELLTTFRRPDDAREFGDVARRIAQKHGFVAYAGRVDMVLALFVAPRAEPLAIALDLAHAARKTAFDVGNMLFAGFASDTAISIRMARGDKLDDVEREIRALRGELGESPPPLAIALLDVELGLIANLRGETAPGSHTSKDFDEAAFVSGTEMRVPIVAAWYHVSKLQAACIRGDHAAAARESASTRDQIWALKGQVRMAEYHLYTAIAHAQLATTTRDEARAEHVRTLAVHDEALREWSEANPQSFGYMSALVGAERERLADRTREALRLYHEAISTAHDNGFTHGEALAYERTAEYVATLGLQRYAASCRSDARRCYADWGALAKVRALDETHPELALAGSLAEPDRNSVLRLAQPISSEIVRSKLVSTLLEVMSKYAGARRAVFIAVCEEKWETEASTSATAEVPRSIIDRVVQTRRRVLLQDAKLATPFVADPYIVRYRPRSVLCLPIVQRDELLGIVYLENEMLPGVFTRDAVGVLALLVEQAGISLDNARLYAERGRQIAERQQAEATLRSILDNIVDAVYVCDRAARITFTNRAGATLIGMRPGEHPALAELAQQLAPAHPDGTPMSLNELPMLRALAGEVISSIDLTIRDPHTQRATHLRLSAAPLQDERGAIAGAVGVAIDVTKTTELDRLKEQFLRVVAHELKTPITIVKGYADVLRSMHGEVSEPQRPLLDALVGGVDRIDRLTTDLLLVWQVQTGRLALVLEDNVDLIELVENAVDRFGPEVAHNVTLSAQGPLLATVDRQLIDKAITNVLHNAVRYSPTRLAIHIEVGKENDSAYVAISDQGVGIPTDQQARLFEPFFRAHADTAYDTGGLGLGLYIAKAIVQLHGGTIDVLSEEGRGSKFRLQLPKRPRT